LVLHLIHSSARFRQKIAMYSVRAENSMRDAIDTINLPDDATHSWLCSPGSDAETHPDDTRTRTRPCAYFRAREDQWIERMSHTPFTRDKTISSACDELIARSLYMPRVTPVDHAQAASPETTTCTGARVDGTARANAISSDK
jgi:hypothetical protein